MTVKTTARPVELARPKLRGASEAFASRLFGSHVTKTNALESLVIASFIRGLPVRDVEATLAEALGDQAAISKSTVSAICGQITGTSPNLIMKPGTTPADLHRNPDVHVSPGTVLVRRRHRARQVITCPGVDVARLQAHDRRAGRLARQHVPQRGQVDGAVPVRGHGLKRAGAQAEQTQRAVDGGMALLARHDPDSRAPASPSRSTSHPTSASTLSAVRASKARRSVMTPILDHTKRSRPPVQLCDAPSIDPRRGDYVPPADSPRPRSGNVMAGFRAGTSGRTASRRAQAGRSRSDAHRNRASGAGSMRRARPNRPPGAAGSWSA